MPIIWFGTEDLDFITGYTVQTSSDYYRSSHSRCSLYSSAAAITKTFAAATSYWLSCRAYNNWISNASAPIVGFGKSGTNNGIFIGATSASANVTITKYDGSTATILATGTLGNLASGVKIDLQVINYGASATVNIWINGVLSCTYTGDISVSGMTEMDQVVIRGKANFGGIFGDRFWFISEIIVSDSDTRSMAVRNMTLTGDGDTNDFTGGYTNCDEVSTSDADYIYIDSAGRFQATLSDLPAGEYSVKAVKVSARATKSEDAAVTHLALGIKSNSTSSNTTASLLDASWQNLEYMMLVNPTTGNTFSTTEINALQIDLEASA